LKLYLSNKTANINGENDKFTTKCKGDIYSSKTANITLVGLRL